MLAKLKSAAVMGIDAYLVEIETDAVKQVPAYTIVGLPDGAVRESRERIFSALKNSGFTLPYVKITVNLAPADIRKEGSAYDLPIALSILLSCELIELPGLQDCLIMGELSLDGTVRPIKGTLPMAIAAQELGIRHLLLPRENAREAAVAQKLNVYPVDSLAQAIEVLNTLSLAEPFRVDIDSLYRRANTYRFDFQDVKGQEHVKRALEVAASGGHNLLLIGPPGSGKTMLARRLPTILPDMTLQEALESTKIHSVAGMLKPGVALLGTRPYRSPHHTISDAGLIGGGTNPRPGEVSLAHNGVLFLDEMPEFKKHVLEVMRQPLEDGLVTISRAANTVTYPAGFVLVGAMNPCPCGYFTDPLHRCTCSPENIARYMGKISGPMMDRIDIHLEVPAVKYEELTGGGSGEKSADIRERVNRTRQRQLERFQAYQGMYCNAHMETLHLRKFCLLTEAARGLLKTALVKLGLSARAYDRIIKVARTIADMAGAEQLDSHHVAEAIQYRSLYDRKLWLNT